MWGWPAAIGTVAALAFGLQLDAGQRTAGRVSH